MFSYKLHKYGTDTLLALADMDLVGKKFFSDKREIFISPEFYAEKKGDAGTIERLAKGATIINAIGQKSVALLIEKGIIQNEEAVEVCGLPHAQVFVIR